LANITAREDLEMSSDEVSKMLGGLELFFSRVLEFVEGVLEMRGLYDGVTY
jgi:hypothetical protein